jgi:HSP20 family protein
MTLPRFVDRFFDENWPPRWYQPELETPPLDVRETPAELVVKAAIPGVTPEKVEITVEGRTLTIKGSFEKEAEEEQEGWVVRELSRGAFTRSITLPPTAKTEEAKATFKDGLLTLTIPKGEAPNVLHVPVTEG